MGVAAGPHGIGNDHPVQPGVDDAVSGLERHSAAVYRRIGHGFPTFRVAFFGIGSGMTEGLHKQLGLEAQAGQFLDFLHGHRSGGILRTDGGNFGFADRSRQHPGHVAGPADHLLRQGIALGSLGFLRISKAYGLASAMSAT